MQAWELSSPKSGPLAYSYIRANGRDAESAAKDVQKCEEKAAGVYRDKLMLQGFSWGGYFRDSQDLGLDLLAERPAGAKLLSLLKKRDIVLVSGFSRIFPQEEEMLDYLCLWHKNGIHLADVQTDDLVQSIATFRLRMGSFTPLRREPRIVWLPDQQVAAIIRRMRLQTKPKSWDEIARILNERCIRGKSQTKYRWTATKVHRYVNQIDGGSHASSLSVVR